MRLIRFMGAEELRKYLNGDRMDEQKRKYTFGNDEFSLEAAYHDCKLVFDGITDDDSFQKADTGLILYYANEIIYALHEALDKDTNVLSNDCISRQAVFALPRNITRNIRGEVVEETIDVSAIKALPSAQSESCEYYALCRHGRDENKLRVRLGFCEYCNKDVDGFVTPLEKNGHAFVRFGKNGWELSLKVNGWHGSAKIRYCPMCGRDLYVK